MRVFITGANGQLARALVATAPAGIELQAANRAECDITQMPMVEHAFASFRPDVVINTAAKTAVDIAEDNEASAFLVNATGAENVAMASELLGARLIQISTDYVFDGRRSTPYPPHAPTNPVNIYGASKLEGERLAVAAAPRASVVRAGWLYSATGRNFLVSILGALRDGRSVSVVRDQVGGPSSVHDFAIAIWKLSRVDLPGTYHWANAGSASWYDFALEIARIGQQLGLLPDEPQIHPVTSGEYASRAKRPLYSVLDAGALVKVLDLSPPAWQQALATEMRRGLSGAQ